MNVLLATFHYISNVKKMYIFAVYDHAQLSRAILEYEVLSLKYDVRDVSTNADFTG